MKYECKNLISRVNSGEDISDMALRVVDYARVSTASFAQRKSLENQLETYRSYIESNPNWTYAGTYSDEAITGTKAALRGGFQQMITDASMDRFDMIVVKDVSRFARNIKECLVYKDMLKGYGVMVYFIKDNINSFRSSDETMLQFMALGAEMEAASARTRTKIVFEQGIQKGRVYGNSKILGYKKDRCKLVVDENEAETVRLIYDLYVHKRMGLRLIAKELAKRGITRSNGKQIPTRTIGGVLENPKYKGYYCGGKTEKIDIGDKYVRRNLPEKDWIMYKDPTIPAIVTEELWDEAARIRAEKTKEYNHNVAAPKNTGCYAYSSKIESRLCPGVNYTHMAYTYKGEKREGWQCRNHKKYENISNIGPTLYTEELDKILMAELDSLLENYDAIVTDLLRRYTSATDNARVSKRLSALQQEKSKALQKLDRLLELYEDDSITKAEYVTRREIHTDRIGAIDNEIEALQNTKQGIARLAGEIDNLKQHIVAAMNNCTVDKELVQTLIDKIYVCEDSTKNSIHLEIVYSYAPIKREFKINRTNKQTNILCNCCSKYS